MRHADFTRMQLVLDTCGAKLVFRIVTPYVEAECDNCEKDAEYLINASVEGPGFTDLLYCQEHIVEAHYMSQELQMMSDEKFVTIA